MRKGADPLKVPTSAAILCTAGEGGRCRCRNEGTVDERRTGATRTNVRWFAGDPCHGRQRVGHRAPRRDMKAHLPFLAACKCWASEASECCARLPVARPVAWMNGALRMVPSVLCCSPTGLSEKFPAGCAGRGADYASCADTCLCSFGPGSEPCRPLPVSSVSRGQARVRTHGHAAAPLCSSNGVVLGCTTPQRKSPPAG